MKTISLGAVVSVLALLHAGYADLSQYGTKDIMRTI